MKTMISRLVRTELESYVHHLVVWGGTVFLLLVLFLFFLGTWVARPGDDSSDYFSLFLLAVGLSSALIAVKVSQQNSIEKRTRLFSQLPVSMREVSFASWCVRLLCLLIPTLAFSLFLARVAAMPFARFTLITLATYLGGTTLIAAISVTVNSAHLPSPMSSWARRVFIACAVIATASWFIGNLLVFPWFQPPSTRGVIDQGLPSLIGLLAISSVGLVTLDVWLRDRLDDYHG
jgi:hypothetical protein